MATTEALCVYRNISKKKWLNGRILFRKNTTVLFDDKDREIDSIRTKKITTEDESIVMSYHEVLCEDIELCKILEVFLDSENEKEDKGLSTTEEPTKEFTKIVDIVTKATGKPHTPEECKTEKAEEGKSLKKKSKIPLNTQKDLLDMLL